MRSFAGKKPMINRLPLAGGWTGTRDFPAPSGKTFMEQYKQQQKRSRR